MVKFSLWAEVQAKPGKEKDVENFLKSAQPLAEQEAVKAETRGEGLPRMYKDR